LTVWKRSKLRCKIRPGDPASGDGGGPSPAPGRHTLAAFLFLASIAAAAELPPHAIAVDRYGTWTCERGYVLTNHRCVAESELPHGSQVIVSDLPSAGDGARQGGGEGEGQEATARGATAAPGAQGVGSPLVIQTNQPWTVVLDAAGNPSAVIVGGPPARSGHSALFGDR
jgi:hypothetical protein